MNRVSPSQRRSRALREPEVPDLTLVLELDHCGDGFLDGDFGVDAVLVVEVYGVDSEALERGVARFVDVLLVTTDGGVTLGVAQVAEFGAEEDFGAAAGVLEPFSDELLVGVGSVDVGAVPRGMVSYA